MPISEDEIEQVVKIVKAELLSNNPGWVRKDDFVRRCKRVDTMFYGLYALIGALFLELTAGVIALVLR